MDELVKTITGKVGISPEQARGAVEQVLTFLKDKLPDPIANQLDKVVSGGAFDADDLGGLLGKAGDTLGGLFGKK